MATKRGTSSIGPKQTARAFHAARYATEIGRPFNLLVTVDTTGLGIDDTDAGVFVRELWARVTRWWAYQRDKKERQIGAFHAVVVHENPDQGPRHAHWYMHVPDEIADEIERVVVSRAERIAQLDCVGKAVHFLTTKHPGGVMKYILKGVDERYAEHFHMEAKDQGEVVGRRITTSRSVGYAARKQAGWTRKKPQTRSKATQGSKSSPSPSPSLPKRARPAHLRGEGAQMRRADAQMRKHPDGYEPPGGGAPPPGQPTPIGRGARAEERAPSR